MAIGNQLSDKNPDGTALGQSSTDTISFYGATPVVRYATSITAPSTTASVTVNATIWAYSTSTQADAVALSLSRVVAALASYGLISTS